MRPVLGAPAVQFRIHLSPQELSSSVEAPPAKKCDNRTCPWWPYSNSNDFKINAGIIVIVLFFAVICALSLNAAIRYLLRRRRRRRRRSIEIQGGEQPQPKATLCSGAAQVAETPTVVFSAGVKLAGGEAECAICLSEFVDGDGIRVLGRCNHGFHVQCIQKWLISRSSCPTCRAICLPPSSSSSGDITGCPLGNGANRDFPSAATESRAILGEPID